METWKIESLRRAIRILAENLESFGMELKHSKKSSADRYQNLSAAIQEHSVSAEFPNGISMGSRDRLRKFANGVPNEKFPNGRKYENLSLTKLEAIASFIVDQESSGIVFPKYDLIENSTQELFPLSMLEYIWNSDPIDPFFQNTLSGTFKSSVNFEHRTVNQYLTFDEPTKDGVFRTVFINEIHENSSRNLNDDVENFAIPPSSIDICRGWGIATPEDNLFVFVKDSRSATNSFYFIESFLIDADDKNYICELILKRHRYPIEFSEIPERELPIDDYAILREYEKEAKLKFLRVT